MTGTGGGGTRRFGIRRLGTRFRDAAPPVPLVVAMAAQTVALGLLVTLSAVYFTTFAGLSVREVGVGLTAAAGVGLGVGIPVGRLADRIGPRGLLTALLALEAAAVLAHLLVTSFGTFLAIVGTYQLADRAAGAVRSGLIAQAVPPGRQVAARAYLRTVTNVGFAVGALLGGLALAAGTSGAFRVLIGLAAGGYLAAAVAIRRLDPVPPIPRHLARAATAALRDRPYLALTALNAILTMHYAVLEVGMPLWVVRNTAAPAWMVTALFVFNAVLVAVLQVPVSRAAEDVQRAGRVTLRSGWLLALACGLFAAASLSPAAVAVAVLVLAGLLHAFGEMYQAAASWTLGYELADDRAPGQYQGLFTSGMYAGHMLGAATVTLLAVEGGVVGWLLLGGLLLAPAVATPRTAAWAAARHRSSPASGSTAPLGAPPA